MQPALLGEQQKKCSSFCRSLKHLLERISKKQKMTTKTPSIAPKNQNFSSWYKRLFAWLLTYINAKYEQDIADRKRVLFAEVHGNVLEIGPGTGPNLSYYPPDIYWVGMEPNPFMYPYLRSQAERLGLDIDIRSGTAEHLDIEDNSMDAVVSTLVLCSVDNLTTTLQEILRVLKPGGRFFFLEHVAAPQKTWLRRIQHAIRPLWQVLGDGCHPDRETWVALENAGFESVNYQHFRSTSVPAIVSPQIIGVATKKAN